MHNGRLDPSAAGASCENPPIPLDPHLTTALPDGTMCSADLDFAGGTEAQVCLQTLGTIFSSGCANTLQLTPCLCGSADTANCLAGTTTPLGALFDIYACDLDSASSTSIQADFLQQSFGAGAANAVVLCAAQSGCNGFQSAVGESRHGAGAGREVSARRPFRRLERPTSEPSFGL